MTPRKSFDCVQMKHDAAARIHKKLKDKSFEQKLAFWRKQTNALKKSRHSSEQG